ncbi:hypothetical protein EV182_003016 [Spiromyces aspiralis]|uniref:Uncharacterized protein n=1 Tax=Spiromyces aspiralis TaxID=68401 RepID=A0ACC1HUP3_9FUNG|nr:hypothetical protein EV182_003016 [Spiromyces aspiralis]
MRECILEVCRHQPALLLPMAWIPLPYGTPYHILLIRDYLWKVFKDEYIKEKGEVSEEREKSFSPCILGMLKCPNGIGIQLDSCEHLIKVLNTPLVWEETPFDWHVDGGISHSLIIESVPLSIEGPRVEAALRPHGRVKRLKKFQDKLGNWFGHWSITLTTKPNQEPSKTITFNGEKVACCILPAIGKKLYSDCGDIQGTDACECPKAAPKAPTTTHAPTSTTTKTPTQAAITHTVTTDKPETTPSAPKLAHHMTSTPPTTPTTKPATTPMSALLAEMDKAPKAILAGPIACMKAASQGMIMGPAPTPQPAVPAKQAPAHTPARQPSGEPTHLDDSQDIMASSDDSFRSFEESDAEPVELLPEDFEKEQHVVEYYPRAPQVPLKRATQPTKPHFPPPSATQGNPPSDGTPILPPVRRLRNRAVNYQ